VSSVASATLATILVLIGGVPLGYLLARSRGRGMALLGFAVQLPLALPPLASGILLLFLLGYASPLGQLTRGALTDSFTGIVLAETFVSAPFLIIAARSAFAEVDPVLEDVAATLGHNPRAVFRRVSLPLVWRATLAGALLAWLRAFGEFGATVMVAYHPYSLPVFTYVAFGSEGLPAMLPVLAPTLLAALVVMAASQIAATSRRSSQRDKRVEQASNGAIRTETLARPNAAIDRSLAFRLRRHVDGFDLDVAWHTKAQRLAILGPSGSGKSMTLRLIAGLDLAQTNDVEINGRHLSAQPPYMRRIAYVPQNYGLLPFLRVEQQIRFAIDSDEALARHWTQRLRLSGLEHRLPSELSLGQQQRVALARALARRADLLLLDEPFSALDAPLRARLGVELCELQREIAATTILVTHDPLEATALADELLILNDGRVLQAGNVNAVFQRPVNETAARLLGADNVGYGICVSASEIDIGNDVKLAVAGPALSPGQKTGWAIRPEQIHIGVNGRYPAKIANIGQVHAGRRALNIEIGGASLRAAAGPSLLLAIGACRVDIDPAAVQVWSAA
jgi:ABC-type Fe3+/spermidine/putrescine transport system ATPase subunit/ABC-type sulfate transport system permease component